MDCKALIGHVKNLEEEIVVEILDDFIARNPTRDEGINVMKACQKGTEEVGRLFEQGKYFAGDLLFAGAMLKEAKAMLQPIIGEDLNYLKSGNITLGPVYGDASEQGEEILAKIVRMAGFVVVNSTVKVS
ncbi:hypothetical protein GH810_05445 [Acetobacterium paludosum]|uniref:B12-binding N-terminal domain-containing protein n=1 Tax=Acetobacterium paludosum TaxID=52693 RepID=A0A923KP40_9FIRM|nr:B12-binding domain-containing protein [Acetobacterium paludosum]MBC3887749.1 hypothetical protein [Acetobacterium paludosum]